MCTSVVHMVRNADGRGDWRSVCLFVCHMKLDLVVMKGDLELLK